MAFKGKIDKLKGSTSDSGNIWSPAFLHSASSMSLETQMNSGEVLLYIYILPYPYICSLARWQFSPIQGSHSDYFAFSLSTTSMYKHKCLAYRLTLNWVFLCYTCSLVISNWPLTPL